MPIPSSQSGPKENVISWPEADDADAAEEPCDAVIAAQQRQHAASEAMKAAIRAKGHRVGVEGVAGVRAVINETQVFAPWLADGLLVLLSEDLTAKSRGRLLEHLGR